MERLWERYRKDRQTRNPVTPKSSPKVDCYAETVIWKNCQADIN